MTDGNRKVTQSEERSDGRRRDTPQSVQMDLGRGIRGRVDVRPMSEAEEQALVAAIESLLTDVIEQRAR